MTSVDDIASPLVSFADATAVEPTGDGRYTAQISEAYAFAGAPNGGYLLATMLRAAVDDAEHEHPLVASVEYHRVAQAGPAEIVVARSRAGRSVTTSRVTLQQSDRLVAEALVTLATLDAGEPLRWHAPRPPIAPLEACVAVASRQEGFPRQVDLRFDPDTDGWRVGRPSGRPEGRAWLRLRRPVAPDPYVLALAVDALPPVTTNIGLPGWTPTVRLTWQLRGLPAPGWLAVHASGRVVSRRWFDEDVEVWDSAGRLVAQGRQMALVGRRHATNS